MNLLLEPAPTSGDYSAKAVATGGRGHPQYALKGHAAFSSGEPEGKRFEEAHSTKHPLSP